ncbi:unnamed protein product [Rhizoctonia solani]|uniref:Peptidase C14 caspase domain-containing protein n=1 Tax=Rhizoctonia solani TaxID=456999 RepID=A0A8H3I1D2_9AGAM|nr:unnamed protein product [Rhizoctonia solani]
MYHRNTDISKAHGLIIGIDKYKRSDLYPDLGGHGVRNATSTAHFLINAGAPRGNIHCLLDERATWRAILNAFDTHLVHNPEIEMGDPILIYLTGYGNCTTSLLSWQSVKKEVEMILPHDVRTFDAQRSYIHDTPEITLPVLLRKLRQKKGHNIAVITDCFHVDASSRGAQNIRNRCTSDPSQHGVTEFMSDQIYNLFPDESPFASPSIPTLWTEEFINGIVSLGSNSSLHTSLDLSRPFSQGSVSQTETANYPVASFEHPGRLVVDVLLGEVEQKITHADQKTHATVNAAGSHKFNSPLAPDLAQDRESRPPMLHGLIIGINNYAQPGIHPDLLGCVADAQSMLEYFKNIGVPESRFICLYDERATRRAILDAFVGHLINNPNIQKHDPIVFYFAGHGDRMQAPRGWQTTDGLVEMILPHDASTFDALGNYNFGIPDLTLAYLLYKLSQEKGNNITVILDSCHSGSGTRGEGARSRNSHDPNAPPIPLSLDSQLRVPLLGDYPLEPEHSVTLKQPSGTLLAPSLESHVLLAACRDEEQAYEVPNEVRVSGEIGDPPLRGLFTASLLKELNKSDLTTTSYTTLIRNLLANPEYRKNSQGYGVQTFQCEGRNQDRLLFSVQNSVSKGKISLIPTRDRSIYYVRIGSAQGVVPGTEFGVFSGAMNPTLPPLAILIATDVGPIACYLCGKEPDNPPIIPADAYATVIRYNDNSKGVRIWADERIKQDIFWQRVLNGLDLLPISWATSPESHDIELRFSNGDIQIRGSHLTPGWFGSPHTLKRQLKFKQLIEMLTAVVYFYFHLRNQNRDAPFRENLSMALRELRVKDGTQETPIYEVKGQDLFGGHLPAGTVATLRPDPSKMFGIELTNTSQENLFPYVLYYDFEDYSGTTPSR